MPEIKQPLLLSNNAQTNIKWMLWGIK